MAQLSGVLEYTNCISAKGYDSPNKCPGYDTKQSDAKAPVMLKLWQMQSTPLFPSLPGSLRPRVKGLDRILSMSQIELNFVLMLNWIV